MIMGITEIEGGGISITRRGVVCDTSNMGLATIRYLAREQEMMRDREDQLLGAQVGKLLDSLYRPVEYLKRVYHKLVG